MPRTLNETPAPRVPGDPPELDVLVMEDMEECCVPCFFWDKATDCPRTPDGDCLCLGKYRPDGRRVLYKPRRLYGNEEEE